MSTRKWTYRRQERCLLNELMVTSASGAEWRTAEIPVKPSRDSEVRE
jgi:hypothetical protein